MTVRTVRRKEGSYEVRMGEASLMACERYVKTFSMYGDELMRYFIRERGIWLDIRLTKLVSREQMKRWSVVRFTA